MQTIKLDLSCFEIPQTVIAKQADVGRKFKVLITDKNQAYTVPEDARLSVWYSGSSGSGNYSMIGDRSAFEVVGNCVTVEMIAQMLLCKGDGMLCLMLNTADGMQSAMWNIPYKVEAVPGIDSPGAKQYYSAFSEIAMEAAGSAIAAREAAEEARKLNREKVPMGLYSRDAITVNKEADTGSFWDQVTEVFESMANESVELLYAEVVSSYESVDRNEPGYGHYRVTISKSAHRRYGYVEATNYFSSAESWRAPTLLTRIMFNGKWSDTQRPFKNIYEAVCSELLWENASVNTVLGPQVIQLPNYEREYNALLLMVNLDTSFRYTIPVLLRMDGSYGTNIAYFPACNYNGKSWIACWRYFFVSEDGKSVSISEGYRDGAVSNSRAIPYKIYGINL